MIASADPEAATMEWDIPKRGPKVFIDHNQNVGGKTTASVYAVRPVPGARVSDSDSVGRVGGRGSG